jgi:hypothetical protein
VVNWGLLYTRSQGQKNFGPTLSIFGLLFGPKLLIKARTLAPRVANWAPKFDGILFPALGPIQAHKAQDLLITWGRLKRLFSSSALTPRVKPLGLIFTFQPIGMLDSGWTSAQTQCKLSLSFILFWAPLSIYLSASTAATYTFTAPIYTTSIITSNPKHLCINNPDLLKFNYFADLTQTGIGGWKEAQRHGDFNENSIILKNSPTKCHQDVLPAYEVGSVRPQHDLSSNLGDLPGFSRPCPFLCLFKAKPTSSKTGRGNQLDLQSK